MTEREKEVLKFIAAGKANLAIAERLGLSVKTIETHKHNIMIKLGVGSTTDLVRKYGKPTKTQKARKRSR